MTKSKNKVLLAVLAGLLAVLLCATMVACGGTTDDSTLSASEKTTYTFEAEDAVLWSETGEYGGSTMNAQLGVEFNSDESGASGTGSIGSFYSIDSGYREDYDDTVTFTIKSDKAVTNATLTMVAASSSMSWTTWQIQDIDLSDEDILTVNGEKVKISGILDGNSSWNYWNWVEVSTTIDLVKGDNEIVFSAASLQYNFDCIKITTSAKLSWNTTDNWDKELG